MSRMDVRRSVDPEFGQCIEIVAYRGSARNIRIGSGRGVEERVAEACQVESTSHRISLDCRK